MFWRGREDGFALWLSAWRKACTDKAKADEARLLHQAEEAERFLTTIERDPQAKRAFCGTVAKASKEELLVPGTFVLTDGDETGRTHSPYPAVVACIHPQSVYFHRLDGQAGSNCADHFPDISKWRVSTGSSASCVIPKRAPKRTPVAARKAGTVTLANVRAKLALANATGTGWLSAERELALIQKLPGFAGLDADSTQLRVRTGLIEMGGYPIGAFEAAFSSIAGASPRFRNLSQESSGSIHPHIHGNGDACFGTFGPEILCTGQSGHAYLLVQATLLFLHNYNPSSCYVKPRDIALEPSQ